MKWYDVLLWSALAALLIAAVTGCASEPTVVHEPVEVKVPVMVPCRSKEVAEPKWATDAVAQDADYFEKTRAVVEELAQRIAYEIELRAALQACTGQ